LLDVYYLESVRAGDVYGCVGEVNCSECTAELVDLEVSVSEPFYTWREFEGA